MIRSKEFILKYQSIIIHLQLIYYRGIFSILHLQKKILENREKKYFYVISVSSTNPTDYLEI
jgi:hypothetical protein